MQWPLVSVNKIVQQYIPGNGATKCDNINKNIGGLDSKTWATALEKANQKWSESGETKSGEYWGKTREHSMKSG